MQFRAKAAALSAVILYTVLTSAFGENLPILISSPKQKIQDNIFTNQQELISNYANSLKNTASKTIVFEIQTPHNLGQTAQILRQSQVKMPVFSQVFANEKTFSTTYMNYDS